MNDLRRDTDNGIKKSQLLKKTNKQIEEYKKRLELMLEQQIKNYKNTDKFSINERKSESVISKARKRKEEIENDSLEQDIALKKGTLIALFVFLATETLLVFLFALFQGFKTKGFLLEEWSFKLLISATIMQITYMLQLAVKHLFPNKTQS